MAAPQSMRVSLKALSVSVSGSNLKKAKACSPEVCKFLGSPDLSGRSRSPITLIISRFIRLHNNQSPGIKDQNWEKNLNILLHGKDRVGLPEVTRLLSPEFTYSTITSSSSRSATIPYVQVIANKSNKITGKAKNK